MLVRKLQGQKPAIPLPKGAIDTQMHMYLPEYPALPGGPAVPQGAPGPDEYRQLMAWLGIDRVVITQGNAHQGDNANLVACLDVMGDVACGVAVIAGETDDAEMQRLSDARVVGARIMDLPGGGVNLSQLEAVDARAYAFNWCIAVQLDGSFILDHEARLGALKSPWILDHHGKFFAGVVPDSPQVDAVKRLIDRGNCWFKFAGCYESSRSGAPHYEDIAAVARVLAAHAPERIIWGTNWPHNLAQTTEDYPDDAVLADTVLTWFPGEAERHLALVENPERLFGFNSLR